jgi:dienelactone hydrolase
LLDLHKVGAFGHSFGGATALEVAQRESRVRAAIDLDGDLFGTLAREGVSKHLSFRNQ